MNLKVGYKTILTLECSGAPETIPEWYVSDGKIARLAVAEDGMSCDVLPVGRSGAVTVFASCFSAGRLIEATYDLTIEGAEETPITMEIAASEPEIIPVPEPAPPL